MFDQSHLIIPSDILFVLFNINHTPAIFSLFSHSKPLKESVELFLIRREAKKFSDKSVYFEFHSVFTFVNEMNYIESQSNSFNEILYVDVMEIDNERFSFTCFAMVNISKFTFIWMIVMLNNWKRVHSGKNCNLYFFFKLKIFYIR